MFKMIIQRIQSPVIRNSNHQIGLMIQGLGPNGKEDWLPAGIPHLASEGRIKIRWKARFQGISDQEEVESVEGSIFVVAF